MTAINTGSLKSDPFPGNIINSRNNSKNSTTNKLDEIVAVTKDISSKQNHPKKLLQFNDDRPYSWIACHQLILSTLQGVELLAKERTKVANSICDMPPSQKSMVVEFVRKVLIPVAMENNACKALSCSKEKLMNGPATNSRIASIGHLWDRLYTRILPNVQSLLYPLEQYESSFDCRKFVLGAYRDRVVVPVMAEWTRVQDPRLYQMLIVISINTRDHTALYESFLAICNECLPAFEKAKSSVREKTLSLPIKTANTKTNQEYQYYKRSGKVRSRTADEQGAVECPPVTRLSIASKINTTSEQQKSVMREERSRPKSVQWDDISYNSTITTTTDGLESKTLPSVTSKYQQIKARKHALNSMQTDKYFLSFDV